MNKIRATRMLKGTTRVQLAKDVGCTERHLQRIEKDEHKVSLFLAYKIAYQLTGSHDVRTIWSFMK